MGGKVKKLRTTNWQLQNSHGDVKASLGNMVDITIFYNNYAWYLGVRLIRRFTSQVI